MKYKNNFIEYKNTFFLQISNRLYRLKKYLLLMKLLVVNKKYQPLLLTLPLMIFH